MRLPPLAAVATLVVGPLALAAQPPPTKDTAASPRLSAARLDDRIVVRVDDRTFTCYRFGAGQKYPYFYPVNGPLSGVSVTTESSLPWPIFDSPHNRWHPSRWFTRDYGFFSPPPFNWLEDAGLRLAAGETLELEYLVVVHAGDADEAGIAAMFAKWAGASAPPRP